MRHFIGLDVGGTKVAAVLVNERMKILKENRRPTEMNKGKKRILENIFACIKELKTPQTKAIGIGIAGFADPSGKLLFLGNLPLKGVNLKKLIQEKFRCSVVIENDANCFALAEAHLGAGKGFMSVVAITLGTGVGGGIVLNKKLYIGSGGAAEFGHMVLDPSGPSDKKGHKGDFEALCSGLSLTKAYYRFGGKKKGIMVQDMLSSKESAAKKTMNQFFKYMGIGLGNLVNVLSPEIIIVGGGLSGLKIYKRLNIEMKKYAIPASLRRTRVVKNKLGETSGYLGAALLASGEGK